MFCVLYSLPGGSDGKASACNAGDPGSIPGSGRSPGTGNGNPLQHSCLENPTDGGAWWATAHGVIKSRTWLSDFTFFSFLSIVWKNVLISCLFWFLTCSSPGFQSPLFEDCLFSVVYSWLRCYHKLIENKCVSLFLGSLFCSIDTCASFCARTTLVHYCSFIV